MTTNTYSNGFYVSPNPFTQYMPESNISSNYEHQESSISCTIMPNTNYIPDMYQPYTPTYYTDFPTAPIYQPITDINNTYNIPVMATTCTSYPHYYSSYTNPIRTTKEKDDYYYGDNFCWCTII